MNDTSQNFRRETLNNRAVRRTLCAEHVVEAVGPIEHGTEIFGLTKGGWSLVDLVEYCLSVTGPADVVLSTWTAAKADVGFANQLLVNGATKSLRFVVDASFPIRQPAYCAALREAFGDDAIRTTKNHAKFVLIRNAEWNLVVRTSMNLNENRRLETWELSDSEPMASWLQEVVDELFREQAAGSAFRRTPGEHGRQFELQWE